MMKRMAARARATLLVKALRSNNYALAIAEACRSLDSDDAGEFLVEAEACGFFSACADLLAQHGQDYQRARNVIFLFIRCAGPLHERLFACDDSFLVFEALGNVCLGRVDLREKALTAALNLIAQPSAPYPRSFAKAMIPVATQLITNPALECNQYDLQTTIFILNHLTNDPSLHPLLLANTGALSQLSAIAADKRISAQMEAAYSALILAKLAHVESVAQTLMALDLEEIVKFLCSMLNAAVTKEDIPGTNVTVRLYSCSIGIAGLAATQAGRVALRKSDDLVRLLFSAMKETSKDADLARPHLLSVIWNVCA